MAGCTGLIPDGDEGGQDGTGTENPGNGWVVNVISMILFGTAIGVLLCFLGGLMAIDIVPRKATGAALGIVGIMSYVAAGIQDIVSGLLIDSHVMDVLDAGGNVIGQVHDFGPASIFWIGASVISFCLPLLNRKYSIDKNK